MSLCLHCGKPCPGSFPGRPKKYCGRECYAAARQKNFVAEYICAGCKKPFSRKERADRKNSSKQYCTLDCRLAQKEKVTCLYCQKEFYISKSKRNKGEGRFCSAKCRQIGLRGENHPQWKGEERILRGFVMKYQPNHPNAQDGYVLKARLIVEASIKRHLHKNEIVGYRDGNKENLELSNLIVATRSKFASWNKKDKELRSSILRLRIKKIRDPFTKKVRLMFNHEIAKQVGCHVATVSDILRELGFQKLNRNRKKKEETNQKKVWTQLSRTL